MTVADVGGGSVTITVAVITGILAIAGIFTAWLLAQVTDERKFHRDKIARWRAWVESYSASFPMVEVRALRNSSVWSEMRPYADRKLIEMIESNTIHVDLNGDSPYRIALFNDITRIETYWERPWRRRLRWWDPHW
jgi:hypothetical protein